MEPIGIGYEISDRTALRDDERRALEGRRDVLGAAVRGADLDDAKRSIARLFGLLPMVGIDAASVEATVTDYARVLSSQPLWAINAACRAVVESGAKFRPGAPELLVLARKKAQGAHAEADQITAVLAAKVFHEPTDAERAVVRDKIRALQAKVPATRALEAATPSPSRAEAEFHDLCRAHGVSVEAIPDSIGATIRAHAGERSCRSCRLTPPGHERYLGAA
jgi:hypothetical protein